MAAKQKVNFQEEVPEKPKAGKEFESLILTQAEHSALSEKQKAEFRAKGGTVSNQ